MSDFVTIRLAWWLLMEPAMLEPGFSTLSSSPPPAAGTPHRVPAFDLLRVVAVAAVALYHYGFHGPTAEGVTYVALPFLGGVARYGYLGVQLFFVISGFVIAFSAEGRSAGEFLTARVSRIYPAFLFCMTLTVAACWTIGAPGFHVPLRQYLANLVVAAPAFHEPYVDDVYWTMILEITFYAWMYVLMRVGQVHRRINLVVSVWLVLSLVNELLIQSHVLRKVLLTDQSGFFAAGLMLYELYAGRRGAATQALLGLAAGCAMLQGILNARLMSAEFGLTFDGATVAAICLAIIILVSLGASIRDLPLPVPVTVALGGLTYPFYLVHLKIGYVVLMRLDALHSAGAVLAVLLAIAALSLVIWRAVDRPGQRLFRRVLTMAGQGGAGRRTPQAAVHAN